MNSAGTIIHGIDSLGLIQAVNLTNNRIDVNSSDRISNTDIISTQILTESVGNGASKTISLVLRNTCVSILIQCGTSAANFNGCTIVLSYSPDGTTYFIDDGKVFNPTAAGRYFETFVTSFKAIKLLITNGTGSTINITASINNS